VAQAVKRALDVAVSAVGLVLTSPFMLAAALAVKLNSHGPVIYRGPRVGRDGRIFQIYKIRTMRAGADASGPSVTSAGDDRVTSVGRLLRRTKADELPQLLNVLKGDMSLVGPRPEHPEFVKHYPPDLRDSLSVRPGMTGPSALAFIDEEEMLAGPDPNSAYIERIMPRKLALDREYVKTASFTGDLHILLRTALLVVRRPFTSRGTPRG
jgi:lipopolysaccharide/colanic/teichoic acid biosynthesis glycosyltransferase